MPAQPLGAAPAHKTQFPGNGILVPSPAASATTAAIPAAIAAAALAPWPVRLGTRFVYGQIAAAEVGAVQCFHRLAGRIVIRHLHKGEASRLSGVAVRNDAHPVDGAILLK